MNILQRTPTRLTLQGRPWIVWVLGPLFMASGSYLALLGGEAMMGGVFAAVGLGVTLAFGETVTCTFDLGTGQFTCERKGPLGTKHVQHSLKEITRVRVRRGGGRHRTFRVELVRKSGNVVPLTSAFSSGKRDKPEIAEIIRGFLGLTDPGEVPVPGFRQLLRMARNPAAHQEVNASYDPVIAGYEAEIERNPENIDAHRNLAMAFAFQNKPEQARAKLEHAKELLMRQAKPEGAAELEAMLRQLDKAVNR